MVHEIKKPLSERAFFKELKEHRRETIILYGKNITTAYLHSLGSPSCMTGDRAKCTELYALNPERVALLYYEEDDYNSMRCLRWKLDNGDFFYDVKYTRDYYTLYNYYYKINMNNKALMRYPSITIKLRRPKLYIPYLDTFNEISFDCHKDKILLKPDKCYKKFKYRGKLVVFVNSRVIDTRRVQTAIANWKEEKEYYEDCSY